MMKRQIKAWFTYDDIIEPQSFMSFLTRWINFHSWQGRIGLFITIVAPLAVLSYVTILEERFLLRSLDEFHPKYGQVIGMSFLGDTMVWPFCFVIPLLIAFLSLAARAVVATLNRLADVIASAIRDESSIRGLVNATKMVFRGGNRRSRLLLFSLPWIAAIAFNAFNATTCYFRPEIKAIAQSIEKIKDPYATTRIFVKNETAAAKYRQVVTMEPVSIKKWDTDRHNAPLSAVTTRIWTLLYYSVAPFVLTRLILLTIGFCYLLWVFSAWISASNAFSLEYSIIQPFSRSSFGGLDYLSNASWAIFFVAVCFAVIGSLAFLKEGIAPSAHNYWLLFLTVPLTAFAFFVPAYYCRKILFNIKVAYLDSIGEQQDSLLFLLMSNPGRGDLRTSNTYYRFMALKEYRSEIARMSVWPFSSLTLGAVIAVAALVPLSVLFGINIETVLAELRAMQD